MKKIIIFSLIFALLIPFTVACSNENEPLDTSNAETQAEGLPNVPLGGKNAALAVGMKGISMGVAVCDHTTKEAVYEFSTQIVKCKVLERTSAKYVDMGYIWFGYSVLIEEIYFNETNTVKEGDIITVKSSRGVLTVSEADELIPDTKFTSFDPTKYDAENDVIVCSNFDGIPIEVGGTYIMFLDDCFKEDPKFYYDSSYGYLYAVYDDIYRGVDITKCDFSLNELEEQIAEDLNHRTGRRKEIGDRAFAKEFGKKQTEKFLEVYNLVEKDLDPKIEREIAETLRKGRVLGKET